MNMYKAIVVLVLIALSCNVNAKQRRFFDGGIKTGSYQVDLPRYDSKSFPYGLQISYDYGNDWSLELEYMQGQFEITEPNRKSDVEGYVWGGYATYRYPTPWYYLVKMGYVIKNIDATKNRSIEKRDEHDFSYGLGTGIRLNDTYGIEVEYTVEGDELALIGLTFRRRF